MASDIFNQPIKNPLLEFNSYGGLCSENGPLNLLSNVFQLVVVVAGLWALINLIFAGIQYIGAQGDPKAIESAWKKITLSFLGLLVIVSAFTIAAIVSALLFGSAGAVFHPQIYGPGTCE
jgi:hypothetical protein